jgi:hypothetical protein
MFSEGGRRSPGEDEEFDADEGLKSSYETEKEESENAEILASARDTYDSLANQFDQDAADIIEDILNKAEDNSDPDNDNDPWINLVRQLQADVLDQFEDNPDKSLTSLQDLELKAAKLVQ